MFLQVFIKVHDTYNKNKKMKYSKASRKAASSSAIAADLWFCGGSKIFCNTQIFEISEFCTDFAQIVGGFLTSCSVITRNIHEFFRNKKPWNSRPCCFAFKLMWTKIRMHISKGFQPKTLYNLPLLCFYFTILIWWWM